MQLLDLLFPKRCVQCKKFGSYICTNCFASIVFTDVMVCTVCQKQAIGGITHPVCQTRYSIDGVFPSLIYKGVVKKLVYVFKYPPYLKDLKTQLVDLFYEGIIQKEQFFSLLNYSSLFVPIPLYPGKFRKRGYNQSLLLAEGLAKRFDVDFSDCLKRIKQTNTQVGLTKEEREKNITGAFVLKSDAALLIKKYHTIFLIDDVVTSGATLREAAKIFKKAGCKNVWGLTLAHGE